MTTATLTTTAKQHAANRCNWRRFTSPTCAWRSTSALIQEIIRDVKVTRVPHAPPQVRGVINLRGEVTTVIDLRQVLGLAPLDTTSDAQTLIVRSQGESIGLIVDRVGDICAVEGSSIVPPPPNVDSVDGRFFQGVCQRKSEIILVLDLEEALSR